MSRKKTVNWVLSFMMVFSTMLSDVTVYAEGEEETAEPVIEETAEIEETVEPEVTEIVVEEEEVSEEPEVIDLKEEPEENTTEPEKEEDFSDVAEEQTENGNLTEDSEKESAEEKEQDETSLFDDNEAMEEAEEDAELSAETPASSFKYTTSDGKVTITKYIGTNTTVIIPAKINNNPVIKIGERAFSGCNNLTGITVSENVTGIGFRAFENCVSLMNLVIPESVQYIDSGAFIGCTGLKTAGPIGSGSNIEYGWTSAIPSDVFMDCDNLTDIEFPDSLISIGEWALYNCTGLTSIIIPNGMKSIGNYSFGRCENLSSISIGNNVTNIGNKAFFGCTSLTEISIPERVSSIGEGVFSGCANLNTITVSRLNPVYDSRDNCNAIIETSTDKLVAGCKTTIIPGTVRIIGNSAFSESTELTAITIPDGVLNIGSDAFYHCTKLTDITIPNSVKSIGQNAFCDCRNLVSISIGNSVKTIDHGVFQNCTKLKEITLPDSLTTLGSYVFGMCQSLSSIIIPYKVSELGSMTFADCNNLKTVVINNAKIKFKDDGPYSPGEFSGDWALEDIYFAGTKKEWDTLVNSIESLDGLGCSDNVVVHYDSSVLSNGLIYTKGQKKVGTQTLKYIIISGYCGQSGDVVIPDLIEELTVIEIGQSAFCGSDISSVNLPVTLETIGEYAFSECENLKTVKMFSNLVRIDRCAFEYCINLQTINIPFGVTEIGSNAFYGCASLLNVSLPWTIDSIGSNAFKDTALTDIYYDNSQSKWNYICQKAGSLGYPEGTSVHCLYDDQGTTGGNQGDGKTVYRGLIINGANRQKDLGSNNDCGIIYDRLKSNKLDNVYINSDDIHAFSYDNDFAPTTKSYFNQRIDYSFEGTDEDDVSFFYYSGHSGYMPDQNGNVGDTDM